MRAGLTRQALRRHPWSFAGPAITQCLAAAIVAGSLSASASFHAARLTAADRRALTASGLPEMAALFVMIAIYLTVVIVGVTMGATIGRQARDIALVRTVGATPGQVRRAVATQAAVVAVPAALAGWPLGLLAGRAWVDGLVDHGVVPAAVTFRPAATALPVALAVTVGTSMIGALVAAIRPSRARPAAALTEAARTRRQVGAARTVVGTLLVTGGAGLSAAITRLPAEQADAAGFFVMLAMCVGAGFLGPALLRAVAPAARLLGRTGAVAADNVAANARALSGAFVPLVLAAAFALVKVAQQETIRHVATVPAPPADRWAEYSGTTVYVAFAAVASLTTLITLVLARRRGLAVVRLAGASKARAFAVVICEALVMTVTTLGTATVVAMATLLPLIHTAYHRWLPWLPAADILTGAGGVLALVLAGTVAPAALAMRGRPVEVVEAGG